MDHIGIDVHKRESQIYVVAEGGEVIERRIRTEPERFAAVLRGRPRARIVDVARGLRIRCDWGPRYIADAWINEVKWLGMTITPSYVGEPECNGDIERFMRTLKEQCLYLHRFQSLAEAREIIGEFIAR
jgi:transposase InsO family protein